MFGDAAGMAVPAIGAPTPIPEALLVHLNRHLTGETIRWHGFKPPRELDPNNTAAVRQTIGDINQCNSHTLGKHTKKANIAEMKMG